MSSWPTYPIGAGRALLFWVAWQLGSAVLAQEPVPPAPPQPEMPPIELPEDWDQRDVEGRWVYMIADRETHSADTHRLQKWAECLDRTDDFELLELIGIYQGWPHVGPVLARRNAPQWIRVALWNLHSRDSHSKDNAGDILLKRGAEVLAWFQRYPVAQRGRGTKLYQQLLGQHGPTGGVGPVDGLPPLDPAQTLASFLDAPADTPVFGDRLTAERGVRYQHQVLRALSGVHVHGWPQPAEIGKLVGLTEHPIPRLRFAAFETLTGLDGSLVPWRPMLARAEDEDAPAVDREWAVMVLSYSSHPRARFEVARIVGQIDHPGWRHAVERVRVNGGPHELAMLRSLGEQGASRPAFVEAEKALDDMLSGRDWPADSNRTFGIIYTAAWAKTQFGDEGESAWRVVDNWLAGFDRSQALQWLAAFRENPVRLQTLGADPDTVAAMEATLDEWVKLAEARSK